MSKSRIIDKMEYKEEYEFEKCHFYRAKAITHNMGGVYYPKETVKEIAKALGKIGMIPRCEIEEHNNDK